jgi:hypothetical protein
MPARKPDAMQDHDTEHPIMRQAALLKPLLRVRRPEVESTMGQTLNEGLELPPAEHMADTALPPQKAAKFLQNALTWAAKVIKPKWLAKDLMARLTAVPEAAEGADAVVAGWQAQGQPVQLVVTGDRLHIVTALPNATKQDSDDQTVARVIEQANAMLNVPQAWERAQWSVRPYADLLLGTRDAGFAKQWHQSVLFITDGRSVKFAAMKYEDRVSPNERETAVRYPILWFGREEAVVD